MNTINHDYNTEIIIILCTLPNNKDSALILTKILLKTKLAACITILDGVKSYYYWNDKFENNNELQLLIKTKKSLEKLVFKKIEEFHPYEIPELLTIPIRSGKLSYLKWIHTILN